MYSFQLFKTVKISVEPKFKQEILMHLYGHLFYIKLMENKVCMKEIKKLFKVDVLIQNTLI